MSPLLRLPPTLDKACGRASNFPTIRCTFSFYGFQAGDPRARYDEMFQHLASMIPGVHTISVTSVVCPNRRCSPVVGGVLLRADGLHFTADGARALTPTLDAELGVAHRLWP